MFYLPVLKDNIFAIMYSLLIKRSIEHQLYFRNPNDSLMEILPVVERLHFDLNLTNLSFLCDTWEVNFHP